MKLPKSSSTVSVEDARGSDEAIWNSYDEAYRRANELALPAADVGDHREHSLQADFASDFVSFSSQPHLSPRVSRGNAGRGARGAKGGPRALGAAHC